MAAASGRYFLNNLDIFDTYGVFVRDGSKEFLSLPKRKDSLTYSWPEENGTEVDLAAPKFEDKEVTLKCGFLAATDTEFRTKRQAFIQAIAAPGWQVWRVIDHSTEYSVRYVDSSNWEKTSRRLKDVPQVIVLFDLQLVVSNEIEINVPDTGGPGLPVTIKDALGNTIATVPAGGALQITSGFAFGLNILTL